MKNKEKAALAITGGVLLVGGLALLASSGSGSGSSPSPSPSPDPVDPYVPPPYVPPEPSPSPYDNLPARQTITDLCASWGVDPLIRDWMIACAIGESGLNPRVMLGTNVPPGALGLNPPVTIPSKDATLRANEAKACLAAWNYRADKYAGCGLNPADFTSGCVGLFGAMPAYAMAAWWDTRHRCTSPIELFAVGPALISALATFARIAHGGYGWKEQGQTFGDMRVGWRRPGAIDEGNTAANMKTKNRMAAVLANNFGGKYTVDSWMPSFPNNRDWFADRLDDWFSMAGPVR